MQQLLRMCCQHHLASQSVQSPATVSHDGRGLQQQTAQRASARSQLQTPSDPLKSLAEACIRLRFTSQDTNKQPLLLLQPQSDVEFKRSATLQVCCSLSCCSCPSAPSLWPCSPSQTNSRCYSRNVRPACTACQPSTLPGRLQTFLWIWPSPPCSCCWCISWGTYATLQRRSLPTSPL